MKVNKKAFKREDNSFTIPKSTIIHRRAEKQELGRDRQRRTREYMVQGQELKIAGEEN